MSFVYKNIFPIFYVSRGVSLKICGSIVIGLIVLLPCFLYIDLDVRLDSRQIRVSENKVHVKTILYWTKMFSDKHFYFGDGKVFKKCPVSACYGTHERDFLDINAFDAILFHGIQINASDLPLSRSRKQNYIFVDMESPVNWKLDYTLVPDGFYNLSMTYRMDSDIPRPYGTIVDKISQNIVYPIAVGTIDVHKIHADFSGLTNSNTYRGKHRMAAWFVSHCRTGSQRERYVAELKEHMDVDIYGKCGPFKCPSGKNECYNMLESHYYFYLSFENSLCEDYVTEKLYHIMEYNVVPIVLGGANYTMFAPPNSYINVADFNSPKHLATYLEYLKNNIGEYEKYFWWKRYYKVSMNHSLTLCKMCEMLHEKNRTDKLIVGLKDWWERDRCKNPV